MSSARAVQTETFFQASKRFTRLQYWNGTGANHLLISYADYGASARVALACLPAFLLRGGHQS